MQNTKPLCYFDFGLKYGPDMFVWDSCSTALDWSCSLGGSECSGFMAVTGRRTWTKAAADRHTGWERHFKWD